MPTSADKRISQKYPWVCRGKIAFLKRGGLEDLKEENGYCGPEKAGFFYSK